MQNTLTLPVFWNARQRCAMPSATIALNLLKSAQMKVKAEMHA